MSMIAYYMVTHATVSFVLNEGGDKAWPKQIKIYAKALSTANDCFQLSRDMTCRVNVYVAHRDIVQPRQTKQII